MNAPQAAFGTARRERKKAADQKRLLRIIPLWLLNYLSAELSADIDVSELEVSDLEVSGLEISDLEDSSPALCLKPFRGLWEQPQKPYGGH